MSRRAIGSMKELVELARAWRLGNEAFKDLFEVLPKEPDAVYNEITHRDTPELLHTLALDECNQNWAKFEARKRTKEEARQLSGHRRELEMREIPVEIVRRRLAPARKALSKRRRTIAQNLLDRDGLVGRINTAKTSGDAHWHKVYLTGCLGYWLLPPED